MRRATPERGLWRMTGTASMALLLLALWSGTSPAWAEDVCRSCHTGAELAVSRRPGAAWFKERPACPVLARREREAELTGTRLAGIAAWLGRENEGPKGLARERLGGLTREYRRLLAEASTRKDDFSAAAVDLRRRSWDETVLPVIAREDAVGVWTAGLVLAAVVLYLLLLAAFRFAPRRRRETGFGRGIDERVAARLFGRPDATRRPKD